MIYLGLHSYHASHKQSQSHVVICPTALLPLFLESAYSSNDQALLSFVSTGRNNNKGVESFKDGMKSGMAQYLIFFHNRLELLINFWCFNEKMHICYATSLHSYSYVTENYFLL